MEIFKYCSNSKCTQSNPSFSKNTNNINGFQNYCKICSKENYNLYAKSKNGIVSVIYKNQRFNSKRRKHSPPAYSKEELRNWLFNQELFHRLYDEWVLSGYTKDLKPSIDRLDDNIGYIIYNIQLTTWENNNNKGYKDMRDGKIKTTAKPQRAVLQFAKDMTLIKEYVSVNEASRQSKVSTASISISCNSTYPNNFAKSFFWKFKI